MATLQLVIGWTLCGLVVILELAIVWLIFQGKIDLSRLISEPNGDASMSRFQLLIFTFVIALSLFLVIIGRTPPAFPSDIPSSVLALLGISTSSYLVSKGIQFSNPEGVEDRPPMVTVTPSSVQLTAGQTQQFAATVIRNTNTAVTWSIHPDHPATEVGSIDVKTGLYTSPSPVPAQNALGPVPKQNALVTVKATSVADASAFGTASITLV